MDKTSVQPKIAEEWALNPDQMLFMLQHHNAIEAAFANDDTAWVAEFMATSEYRALFGEMGFDEAYDRYETTLARQRW